MTLSKSSGSLKQTNNEISGKCEKDNTLDFTVNWNLLNLFLDAFMCFTKLEVFSYSNIVCISFLQNSYHPLVLPFKCEVLPFPVSELEQS